MRIIEDETEMLKNRGADHLLIEFVAAATSQHRPFDRVRPKLEVLSLPHISGHRFTEADAGNGLVNLTGALRDQRMRRHDVMCG